MHGLALPIHILAETLGATLGATMVSPWIILPLAGLTMLLIGAHVMSVQVSAMHRTRKRLRIANGLIMMFVVAALAYALGGVPLVTNAKDHPEQARAFVLVWMVIVALLSIVVVLAVIDAIGTAGWGLRTHQAMRRDYRASIAARKPGERGDDARG